MRNLVPLAVEELQSFKPGNCHACRELHRELKEALMDYLLTRTWTLAERRGTTDMRAKSAETELQSVLTEFHSHRKDTHFSEYFPLSWMRMAARNAS